MIGRNVHRVWLLMGTAVENHGLCQPLSVSLSHNGSPRTCVHRTNYKVVLRMSADITLLIYKI